MFKQTLPSKSMFGWYIFCVHFTLGGSWGKFWLMTNVKLKAPPLYIPSSGSMVRVKLRISSGLGKLVRIVEPSDSSLRSAGSVSLFRKRSNPQVEAQLASDCVPRCTRNCAAVTFFFFVAPPCAASSFCCCCFCRKSKRKRQSYFSICSPSTIFST